MKDFTDWWGNRSPMICYRSELVLSSCLLQKNQKSEEVDLRVGGGAPGPILLQVRVHVHVATASSNSYAQKRPPNSLDWSCFKMELYRLFCAG